MKSPFCLLALLSLFSMPMFSQAADPWKTVEIWPDGAPNEEGQKVEEEAYLPIKEGGDPEITRLGNVSKPTMDIFPAEGEGPRPTVVIFPGGGYHILAMKHEGTMVADWLNELGYTALVVKYRVPRREGREPHGAPLEDARKAMALAHENAEAWNLDPEKIGVLGFSAGGNLAAHVAYGKEVASLPKSQQADFAVLVYPAYLQNDEGQLQEQLAVTESSPPAFLVHAADDRGAAHVDGSAVMYLALSVKQIPVELHIFRDGKHGFGMLDRGNPINRWPAVCADWLKLTLGDE